MSAVQIHLPHGFRSFNAHPASHFDSEDCVFFSTENTHHSCCILKLNRKVVLPRKHVAVSCLFVCLNWNGPSEEIKRAIVDRSKCSPLLISQFFSGVEQEQHDLMPWVTNDLGYFGISLQNLVTFEEIAGIVMISFVIRKVFSPNICSNEMHQVDITWAGKRTL
jgi:hypothetical protein